jgi:hypothetical protein
VGAEAVQGMIPSISFSFVIGRISISMNWPMFPFSGDRAENDDDRKRMNN